MFSKKKHNLKNANKSWTWIVYLLPALLIYLFFMAYPLLNSLRLSFFTGSGFDLTRFVGFDNYIRLFKDPQISERYWGAFKNTWIFFGIHMCVQNVLGLFFANLLTRNGLKGSDFYRTIIFLPATMSVLVTGYLWKLILNPQWGALNLLLGKMGLLREPFAWLGETSTALTTISLVSAWQWVGMPTMIFLASLQNISKDLFEAAAIDGASPFQTFWKIKLPLLKPIIGIVAILTFTSNFNAFAVVFAMENANGAPQFSTDIMGTFFYRIGIAGQHPVGIPDRGMGAAVATLTFLLLALGVTLIMGLTNREEK